MMQERVNDFIGDANPELDSCNFKRDALKA